LYILRTNRDTLIVVVCVDELLITGNNNDLIHILKKQLADSFDMPNLGTLHYFLGLQLLSLCNGFFTSQSKYVMDLLKKNDNHTFILMLMNTTKGTK
jgi:hypothetical protein